MRTIALLALLAGLVAARPAKAERLFVSLSSNNVSIGSNYTGTQLALFGLIEPDSETPVRLGPMEVVVTLRGPRENMTVRQKGRVGPVWINRTQQKFVAVPTVLGVASTGPLDEIVSGPMRRQLRLGLSAIVEAPEMSFESGPDNDPFRPALIRLKVKEGVWSEDSRGVTFVSPGFFRAPITLPATAPTGNYDVEVVALSGDNVVARRNASFEVSKTGFEDEITGLSQDRSLLYGLFIAALSLLFGWIASVIFRRD